MATLPIRNVPGRDLSLHERSFFEVIQERRATAHFEPTPIPQRDLEMILRAGLEAPSGYNLQPWRFVVVQDEEMRKKLRGAAMNQPKVEEAPVVIVACGNPEAYREDIDDMLSMAAEHGYGTPQGNAKVKQVTTGIFSNPAGNAMGVSPDWAVWVNRHVMIAFTTLMWAAEVMGYDTAPMEGFVESQVKQVLGIPPHIRVVALLAIGHRKGEDKKYGGRFPVDRLCFSNHWGEPFTEKKAA